MPNVMQNAELDKMIQRLPPHVRIALSVMAQRHPPLTEREVIAVYSAAVGFAKQILPPEKLVVVLLDIIVEIVKAHRTSVH